MTNTNKETITAASLVQKSQTGDAPDRSGTSAVMYVESSHSFCGECGRGTLWTPTHEKVAGYGPPNRKGCGAKFIAVTPLYEIDEVGVEDLAEGTGLPVVRSSPFPELK